MLNETERAVIEHFRSFEGVVRQIENEGKTSRLVLDHEAMFADIRTIVTICDRAYPRDGSSEVPDDLATQVKLFLLNLRCHFATGVASTRDATDCEFCAPAYAALAKRVGVV